MKIWPVFLILAGGSLALSACVKAIGPSRATITAVLNQQAEGDFFAYLSSQPSDSVVAGHIVPVERVSNLACNNHITGTPRTIVECRYFSHSASGQVRHISTFELDGKAWRLVDDKEED
ncbi:MAG: hypothetical protein KDD98_05005 [Sphingomonadaceae bacterium]|nr:hypothetical protein [Sphingomonadaceae bacterium]